ncbi:MAG: hypothetical protein EOO52_10390 [Gammaproteobacteria bacterium]|nr:MAG: hypothetical protein EOO52_10390 [Gammaproteobacteria bacterium]
MRIHQQRVPIISPLDKDYYRSPLNSGSGKYTDEPNSLNSLSSFNDSPSIGKNSDLPTDLGDTVNSLGFIIVGERDIQ